MRIGLLLVFIIGCLASCQIEKVTIIYLVRHAEKAVGNDPGLTREGTTRANDLAEILQDVPLDGIYSSDFKRTLSTALPISEAKNINIQRYNHQNLYAFAEEIKAKYGTYLIVGHSNTTPEMVALLGGTPGEPIAEWEYDRMYRLMIKEGKVLETEQLTYGEKSYE